MDKKAPKADTPKAGVVDEAAVMELECKPPSGAHWRFWGAMDK